MTLPTIPVTSAGTACPVAPCPASPAAQSRLSEEIRRQACISLAKIKLNPVPKK